MTTGAIIFARMSSSRLPGKSLLPIGGRSLIGRVIDRSKAIGLSGPVVLATSARRDDDILAETALAEGIEIFRGALEDVAGRAVAAAQTFGFSAFARICGDRPFFDPKLVAHLAKWQAKQDLDLATNIAEKSFPPGLTAEVVKTDALVRSLARTTDAEDREHVTRFLYSRWSDFYCRNFRADPPLDTSLSLAVDTYDDLDRACFIARKLADQDGPAAPSDLVLSLAADWYANRGADFPRIRFIEHG